MPGDICDDLGIRQELAGVATDAGAKDRYLHWPESCRDTGATSAWRSLSRSWYRSSAILRAREARRRPVKSSAAATDDARSSGFAARSTTRFSLGPVG